MQELKSKARSALVWNSINQFGKFGFRFIITVVLARLLSPNDFGLIAMILVFTSISDLIIDGGFKIGIVQRKDLDDIELSSVFYLNILIGVLCALITYAVAPLLSSIYGIYQLEELTKGISVLYIFNSFSIVPQGLLMREMEFKKITVTIIGAQLIAGIVAITSAMYGFGVWSLILNYLIEGFCLAILFWLQIKWKPKIQFSFGSIRNILNFSYKLLVVNILAVIVNKVDLFFIGKFFNSTTVGLYSKGKDFSLLPSVIGVSIINSSFFPIFSRLQDNHNQFNSTYLRLYNISMFVAMPLSGILFLISSQLVSILLGPNWIESIVFFKWSTIISAFYIANGFMNYIINAKGRSDLNLKKTIFQLPFRILIVIMIPVVFSNFSPIYYIIVYVIFFFVENLLNTFFISKISLIPFGRIFIIWIYYFFIVAGLVILFSTLTISSYIKNLYVQVIIVSLVFALCYLIILKLLGNNLLKVGQKIILRSISRANCK